QYRFVPASNQKLLTTATALDALGSDYRYETVLFFDGAVRGDVLKGDLIIRGSGDPTFGSALASGEDPLRTWARRLAELGVTRIEGMGAAIWSTSLDLMLDFPATFFARFFHNHGLLSINDRPQWYVVKGGSRAYVEAMTRRYRER